MAGTPENVKKGWAMIKECLTMDEPEKAEKFIGCEHTVERVKRGNAVVTQVSYKMKDFLNACVDRYLELAKKPRESLRKVGTPFLPDEDLCSWRCQVLCLKVGAVWAGYTSFF